VHKADCERLIAAYQQRPNKKQVFAAMFKPAHRPALHQGQADDRWWRGLGEIRRINWIITDWFRSEGLLRLPAAGGATWKGGEGRRGADQPVPAQPRTCCSGLFGHAQVRARLLPVRPSGHNIETEDAVTAYLEYANGATGVFITTHRRGSRHQTAWRSPPSADGW